MSRQGYLILHEKKREPAVVFFSLEDGYLRYYASPLAMTKCLGELRLSGCKIVVKAQKRLDGMPNSFFIETRKVFVKDRSYTLGQAVRLELSAYCNDDRQEWGKVLFSWQRYYWRDPCSGDNNSDKDVKPSDDKIVRMLLEQQIEKFQTAVISTGPSTSSIALAAAKQPLSFLRRNAHSLRRSLSYTMSSLSTTSTASSSVGSAGSAGSASTSTNQIKHQQNEAEPMDCAKDKVVLCKVACPETRISAAGTPEHFAVVNRGNNQQSHAF